VSTGSDPQPPSRAGSQPERPAGFRNDAVRSGAISPAPHACPTTPRQPLSSSPREQRRQTQKTPSLGWPKLVSDQGPAGTGMTVDRPWKLFWWPKPRVVVLIFDQSLIGLEGFVLFVGAAGSILLLNVLHRIDVSGDAERARRAGVLRRARPLAGRGLTSAAEDERACSPAYFGAQPVVVPSPDSLT
jgi:hypothetical protein